MATLILPGLGGSGAAHWQSRLEAQDPSLRRFAPASWDQPEREDWIAALDRGIEDARGGAGGSTGEPVLLVAHSLACLLVAHWAAGRAQAARVAGAFLVAPPDPDGADFPRAQAGSFVDPPQSAFPFPALVVASANDPYASLAFAERFARTRGAGFVGVGALGHINADSGLGAWDEGQRLLRAFAAGCGVAAFG
ncbi:alpha/beta hydrolase [Novosphingobium sp. 1949]|uniref:Alpha/beta hydrolase n=1 Tax=Novosphingobium organovorum TaxID=2930092 RepID=A0ABT0BE16_9SPHN|nr:alpha/beta hydrolase [Novosphingobium organovorum]MCJ2183093.1 alpha/beta hydrolase [Novosphingobium organovorum]